MKQTSRSDQRKEIMTILYQIYLLENKDNMLNIDCHVEKASEIEDDFMKELLIGILQKRVDIDEFANSYLTDWTIDRLGKVDQAILRMAIYEILWTDTPDIVCIDEAIELSKQFSDDSVRKMINGTLDKIYHNKK